MTTAAHASPLLRLVALLCFAATSLCLCLLHVRAGPVVAGASGPLPHIGSADLVGGVDVVPGHWGWSYLDATPPPPSADSASPPFPFRLGVADADPRDLRGGRFVPAVRYGHAAVAIGGCMIVTHGYHYAMSSSGGGAQWLSDTWSFHLATRRWRRLHDHVRHPAAGPVARYAALAVAVAGDMFLHGGDDGGHAAGRQSYTHAVYADLWRFVLTESVEHTQGQRRPLHSWLRVPAALSAVPVGPLPHLPATLPPECPRDGLYRAQHAGALAPLGSDHELHALDSAAERAAAGASTAAVLTVPAPYWFVTHGLYTAPRATTAGGAGGSGSGSGSSPLFDDFDVRDSDSTFVFSFRSQQWRLVRTANRPPPRFGHSLVYVPEADADLDPDAVPAQPRGALYLYGGLSRAGVNRGDLWVLPLQSASLDGGGDGSLGGDAAFVWRELHGAQASSRGPWPAARAYHGCAWTGDGRLHVFGGARCEPGCVCSAEYWLFDLRTQQWALAANSPHSPDSRKYPARAASGVAVGVGAAGAAGRRPPFGAYTTADESVAAGWPVHRYKHSMVAVPLEVVDAVTAAPATVPLPHASAPSSPAPVSHRWSFLIFGGESYNPSAYFQDVWRLDYTREGTAEVQAEAKRALETLLHVTAFPQFSADAASPPAGAFYRHEPPGGWGPYEPDAHSGVLEWDDGNSQPGLLAASSRVWAARLLGGGFWLSVLYGVLLSLLLVIVVVLVALRCSSRWRSRADVKKQF